MRKQRKKVLSLLLAVMMFCFTALPASAEETVQQQQIQSAAAATMRLMKTEGTVAVTGSTGRGLSLRDNMLLYNGYHISTQAASYAWISLDSQKLIKLDAVSEAEVRKADKLLEVMLNSGALFFNVTSPLDQDEALNIRTSTMVIGIRGTSGWVRVLNRWSAEIVVLEGAVECTVTDPVTNQVKSAVIHGGEKAIAIAYDQERPGDKCDILMGKLEPEEIDGFVLAELAGDDGLRGEILQRTGLDLQAAAESAQERLAQDEREMRDRLDSIQQQLAQQESDVSTNPVWRQEDRSPGASNASASPSAPNAPGASGSSGPSGGSSSGGSSSGGSSSGWGNSSDGGSSSDRDTSSGDGGSSGGGSSSSGSSSNGSSSGGSSGGGSSGDGSSGDGSSGDGSSGDGSSGDDSSSEGSSSSDTSSSDPNGEQSVITLSVEYTNAQEVQNYLNTGTVIQVILQPSNYSYQLDIDNDLTVPTGKTLTGESGVELNIQSGGSLTVYGTADIAGYLINNGETTVGGTLTADTIGNRPGSTLTVNGTVDTRDLINDGMVTVNSSNTLRVSWEIINDENGTIINNSTGRIVAPAGDPSIVNTGTFINSGKIECGVISTSGDFTMRDGELDGFVSAGGSTFTIAGGKINGNVSINGSNCNFTMEGGEIISSESRGTVESYSDYLTLTGGIITNTGDGPALNFTYHSIYKNDHYWRFDGTIFRSRSALVIAYVGSDFEDYDHGELDGYTGPVLEGDYYVVRPQ